MLATDLDSFTFPDDEIDEENEEQKKVQEKKEKKHENKNTIATVVGVLFHGSPYALLKQDAGHVQQSLTPRPSKVIDNEKAVFATSCRWLALVFAGQARSNDLDYGFLHGKPYISEVTNDAFNRILNRSGHVYTVPADNFVRDSRLGMPNHEFICRDSAVVVLEHEYVPNLWLQLQQFQNIRMIWYKDRVAFETEFPRL